VGKLGERERAPQRPDAARAAFADGRRAWPAIALPEAAFLEYLAARGEGIDHVADLYLACAVGHDDAAAIAAFESNLLGRVGQFIGHLGRSQEFVREVTQLLRIKLLVGLDGAAKLAQYAGRGTLDSWVCAAALRTAYDLLRERASDGPGNPGDDRSFDVLAASDDVELQLLRARHHEEFRQALRAAMGGVAPRERTLLRLYFLEQVTAARIGQMYGVHETTALRWIARARDGIVERMRSALRERLQLPDHEFGELMALLRSRIDITVRDLLRTT
jgi:RNA polymerase sigma-70 factor (ECF subfamily)